MNTINWNNFQEDLAERNLKIEKAWETDLEKGEHSNHKYIRKENGKYVYKEGQEDNRTDKENTDKKYKALVFSQSDPERGDIQMRILPFLKQGKFRIEKTVWLPKNEDGTQRIQTGHKDFDLSEYDSIVEKFRSLKGIKEKEL